MIIEIFAAVVAVFVLGFLGHVVIGWAAYQAADGLRKCVPGDFDSSKTNENER